VNLETCIFLMIWVALEIAISILLIRRTLELNFDLFDLLTVALPIIALLCAYCSTIPDKSWFQILVAGGNIIIALPFSAVISYLPLVVVNLIAEHKEKKKKRKEEERIKAEEQEAERRRIEKNEQDEKRRNQLQSEILSINSKYKISITPFLSQLSQFHCNNVSSGIDERFRLFCYDKFIPFVCEMNAHVDAINSEASSLGLSLTAKEIDTVLDTSAYSMNY